VSSCPSVDCRPCHHLCCPSCVCVCVICPICVSARPAGIRSGVWVVGLCCLPKPGCLGGSVSRVLTVVRPVRVRLVGVDCGLIVWIVDDLDEVVTPEGPVGSVGFGQAWGASFPLAL
jgi:hypothetical protein